MFDQHISPVLPPPTSRSYSHVFKCFGLGESEIQARLGQMTAHQGQVKLAYRPSFPQNTVTATCEDQATLTAAAAEIRAALGQAIFAEEDIDLPQALGRALSKHRLTVATAESCTGGLIAHGITQVPGASSYFLGATVAYDNRIKVSALGVDPEVLNEYGAVSEPVVRAMAQGICKALGADLGLATSGIAGPDGGTAEKPVGLVHIAVAHPGGVEHRRRVFAGMDRSRVKQIAAWTALKLALDLVLEGR